MKKQMTILLIVVGMLIGAGCGNLTPPSAAEIATFDFGPYPDQYQEIIKNYVIPTMIDPESAMFRFEHLVVKQMENPFRQYQTAVIGIRPLRYGWIVTVSINGRNRFGGYAGWQPRWYMIRYDVVITEGFIINGICM